MNGDLHKDRLGLSDQDYDKVIKEVGIIFHNASDSGKAKQKNWISKVLETNVLGTKRILELSSCCKLLKCFVYVSSTCAQAKAAGNLKEDSYPAPGDIKYINDMIEADNVNATELNNESLKMMIGEWSNLSAFSKAISEDLVTKHATTSKYPCCIFRPSISEYFSVYHIIINKLKFLT